MHTKTSMISNQEFDLDDVNSESAKVPDLIFVLRSAFQPKDFKKVKDILVSRENRLNEEIQNWKRQYELVEEKEGATAFGKALVEEEMDKCRRQLNVLTEQVTRLNEDTRLERERSAVFEDREKRAQAKCTKLAEDNERLESEKKELVAKNSEFYSERVKAERELESVKKKNKELELRVTRLEKVMDDLLRTSREQPPVEDEKGSSDAMNDKSGNSITDEVKNVIFNETKNGKSFAGDASGHNNVIQPKRNGQDFGIHPCTEGQMVLERGDSSPRNKRQKTNTAVIDISDSDNGAPTQDQTPSMPHIAGLEQPVVGNRITVTNGERRGSFLDIGDRIEKNKNGLTFSSCSSDSSDCDSDTLDGMVSKMRTKDEDLTFGSTDEDL